MFQRQILDEGIEREREPDCWVFSFGEGDLISRPFLQLVHVPLKCGHFSSFFKKRKFSLALLASPTTTTRLVDDAVFSSPFNFIWLFCSRSPIW